jgi:D-hydroxyproline dehydrogenase
VIVYDMSFYMTSPKTAQVIGGGIVGFNAALALQERGIAVRLIEMTPDGRPASWGNAGHIAVEQVEPLASWSSIRTLPTRLYSQGGAAAFPPSQIQHWLPFGLKLLNAARPARFAHGKLALSGLLTHALPAWRRRLKAVSACHLLREQGHIIAWESDKSARRGRQHWASADTGTARWRDLNASEAYDLEQLVRHPLADAIKFEGSAQLADPGDTLDCLKETFIRAGGAFESHKATPDRATLAAADVTVVCAGVYSAQLLKPFGHRVPIIAERGYHIQVQSADWPFAMPPIVFEDRALVATGFRRGLRATSFVEFSHPDAPADPRKWAALKRHVAALGLPFCGEMSQWIGCRPTLPDYLPAIGRSNRDPRIIYAFGHQHLGLTLGPITGELVAAIVTGDKTAVDLSPFSLDRFERIFA